MKNKHVKLSCMLIIIEQIIREEQNKETFL